MLSAEFPLWAADPSGSLRPLADPGVPWRTLASSGSQLKDTRGIPLDLLNFSGNMRYIPRNIQTNFRVITRSGGGTFCRWCPFCRLLPPSAPFAAFSEFCSAFSAPIATRLQRLFSASWNAFATPFATRFQRLFNAFSTPFQSLLQRICNAFSTPLATRLQRLFNAFFNAFSIHVVMTCNAFGNTRFQHVFHARLQRFCMTYNVVCIRVINTFFMRVFNAFSALTQRLLTTFKGLHNPRQLYVHNDASGVYTKGAAVTIWFCICKNACLHTFSTLLQCVHNNTCLQLFSTRF